MKRVILGLMAATMFGGVAEAAVCTRTSETEAFNVIGLKSALMVGALACNQRDQYDAFMMRFQPHILAEQHVVDAYFRRAGGRTQEDNYVTNLANTQSQDGIAQGAAFCQSDVTLYKTILALKTNAALDSYATANPPHQPIEMASCIVPAARHGTIHAKPVVASKKKKRVRVAESTTH